MANLTAGGNVGQGRPTNVTTTPKPTGSPEVVGCAYDGVSRRAAITLPPLGGQTRQVAYAFDGAGRLASTTDWLGRQSTVAYTADGLPNLVAYANGVTGTSAYDQADRLNAITYKDAAAPACASTATPSTPPATGPRWEATATPSTGPTG